MPGRAGGPVAVTGRVYSVAGGDVITIKLEPGQGIGPQIGDEVAVSYALPDGTQIEVGTWRVTGIEGETVTAEKKDARGPVNVDMLASITTHATAPPRPSHPRSTTPASGPPPLRWDCHSTPDGPCLWVRFKGRDYQVRYSHQINRQNIPIDVYYYPFMKNGRPVIEHGRQRWERFARVPARDYPDQSHVELAHVYLVREANGWGERAEYVSFKVLSQDQVKH